MTVGGNATLRRRTSPPSPDQRPEALLFDFDGVLIDSQKVMRQAFFAALDEIHPDRRSDRDALFVEYQKYLGMGFPQIMVNLRLSPEMFAPFRQHSRRLAGQVRLYDGVVALLDWSRAQGFRLGIATGKDLERTLELLTRLGIRDHFDSVYCSDTVSAPKPAPEMALRFAAEHGIAPGAIILLGDAAADIRCGQAAGCRTAAVAWGYTDGDALLELAPTFLFRTPQDARAQLERLTAGPARRVI